MPIKNRKASAAAKTWPEQKGTPIVFAAAPSKYEVVVPEELTMWEFSRTAALKAYRLSDEQIKNLKARGIGTWSFSPIGGGYDTFDDSDEI